MERERSTKNCVRGAGASSGGQSGSATYSSGINRFGGLMAAPRTFIECSVQPYRNDCKSATRWETAAQAREVFLNGIGARSASKGVLSQRPLLALRAPNARCDSTLEYIQRRELPADDV